MEALKSKSLVLIKYMSEVLELIKQQLELNVVGNGTRNLINSFIDSFIAINSNIDKLNCEFQDKEILGDLSNLLVRIVNDFEKNKIHDINNSYNKIYDTYKIIENKLYEHFKYNIIVLGNKNKSNNIYLILNDNVGDIIYIHNNKEQFKHNCKKCTYDYLIICDEGFEQIAIQFNDVYNSKIINLYKFFTEYCNSYKTRYYSNEEYNYLYSSLNNIIKDKSYEVFTTGLSYAIHGIDNSFLRKKSSKLTLPSQDLYYDFLIAKRVLEANENIKYCIMGLAYFSFNSDLSLQSEAYKIEKVYYPIFKDAHNYKISSNYFEPLKLKI